MLPNFVSKFLPFYGKLDYQAKYNMKIESLSAANFGVFGGAFYPFFAVMAVKLGISSTLLALLTAAPFMGQLFAVYWGHRSDQGQKLPYVIFSGVISRFLIVLLAFVSKPEVFAFFIILHYLTASIGGPAYTSLIKKIYPLEYRGQIMGRLQFIMGFLRMGSSYLAGMWLDSHGYTGIFLIAGIFGVLSTIIFTRIKEGEDEIVIAKKPFSLVQNMSLLKEDGNLRLAITGFMLFGTGNLMLAPIYPLVQIQVFNMNNFQIGQLAIFWIIGWFLTASLWGWIVDRFQPLYAIIIAIVLYLGSPILYFMQSPFHLLLLASFIAGAAGSSQEVGWQNLMMKLGGEKSSRYSGIYLTMLGVRGLIGPLLSTFLLLYINIFSLFLITCIMLMLGLIPFMILKRRQGNDIKKRKLELARVAL